MQIAGNTIDPDDQYTQLIMIEGKICCMLRYQALYRSLRREDRKLYKKKTLTGLTFNNPIKNSSKSNLVKIA